MLLGLEPGAPAERGGLLPGDILLAIGGRTVEDGEALQMALGPGGGRSPDADQTDPRRRRARDRRHARPAAELNGAAEP